MPDLSTFAQQLAETQLTQVELAVALVWFHDHQHTGSSVSLTDICKLLHEQGLSGSINRSRLFTQLSRHRDVIRGSSAEAIKLRAASRSRLDETYAKYLKSHRKRPSDSVFERAKFQDARPCWRGLVEEINACNDGGHYNACAVLCRRLVESLLIAAFEQHGVDGAIVRNNGDYPSLDSLIGHAVSGKHFRLDRVSKAALPVIKRLGDIAAHSPHHLVSKAEVMEMATHARPLTSKLLELQSASARVAHPA